MDAVVPVVELSRPGDAPGEGFDFGANDITVQAVARVFQLEPSSVWLRQEYGRKLFFPDRSGSFNLGRLLDCGEGTSRGFYALLVEGTPLTNPLQDDSNPTPPCVVAQDTNSNPPPLFKSTKKNEAPVAFNVKIVKSTLIKLPNGKVDFDRQEQVHISVNESSANVHTITNAVQAKWGASYIVVTGDGLPVDDSAGTQGKFWRVPSRKFYAISQTPCKRSEPGDNSSDDDFEPTKSKKKKAAPQLQVQLTAMKSEVALLRADMKKLYKIDRFTQVSPALYEQLYESFKCAICRNLTTPHVIFGRCCKSIIGCQGCIDTWYRGEDGMAKACPRCGTPRALPDTMRLHGLDDFLQSVKPLVDVHGEPTTSGTRQA